MWFCCRGDSSHNRGNRHVPNKMLDYSTFMSDLQQQQEILPDAAQTTEQSTFIASAPFSLLRQETKTWIYDNVELVLKQFPPDSRSAPISVPGQVQEDSSIYVGCGGNAYVHWKLACFFEAEREKEKAVFHLESAVKAVEVTLKMVPRKPAQEEIAFYTGSAGSYK